MMWGEEYRSMSPGDKKAVRRFVKIHIVVSTVCLLALIAITSRFAGENPSSLTADGGKVTVHAEAR
jgi:hypothetical protein